jgi:urease accessory protein
MMKRLRLFTVTAPLALVPALAYAHSGDHGMAGFAAGFAHPLTGPDHLAAMLAVGLWSALAKGELKRAVWAPVVFAATLLLGALATMLGDWQALWVEPGIAVSLLCLGLLVAWRVNLSRWVGLVLTVVFALAHGAAHGTELLGLGSLAGMVLATAVLHSAGLAFGLLMRPTAMRWSEGLGATLMTFGALRLAGVL